MQKDFAGFRYRLLTLRIVVVEHDLADGKPLLLRNE